MSKLSVLLCATYVLFLTRNSEGIAFRSFKNRAPSSCNTETALAALGCPCALVGQRCRDFGSLCFGPGNSLIGNIGNGSPKRGICACGAAYPLNPFTKTCLSSYFNIPSASAGKCLFRDETVTTANLIGFTGPMKWVLGVVNATVTPAIATGQANYYLTNPLVSIDTASNQVYAIESPITPNPVIAQTVAPAASVFTGFLASVTSVTQCYQAIGIDANNQVTNPTTFCVTFSPMDPTCTCSKRPCTTSSATSASTTGDVTQSTQALALVTTSACVKTCPVAI